MIRAIEEFIDGTVFLIASWFLAIFPIMIAALSVNSSRLFLLNRVRVETESLNPHEKDLFDAKQKWPLVSIVIPARDEEGSVEATIRAALKLDWPKIEVIVINDGSVEAASSEVVMILDADGIPARNVLSRMVPHFYLFENVLAVAGNPRIINTPNLLSKLQAIEFSSTISTLRRGQSAWGRINTISGIMALLRRDKVLELGGFAVDQPTEDIELTWRIHSKGYRCVYEPAHKLE